jgi:DNA topoisomerase-1
MSTNGSIPPDAEAAARDAGLRYVTDEQAGITRRRRGKGFSYHAPDGSLIRDPGPRERIKALAIPPAWTGVWISPRANGHIQATGRDDRGRKQYIYHEQWREVRDRAKFNRMLAFGERLPALRQTVEDHLGRRGVGRERVLATTIRLLETSCIRVGNEQYRDENGSYGLTTLLDRHAAFDGSTVRLTFTGKGGKPVEVEVDDARIARMVRRCQEIPGQHLFQYIDDKDNRVEVDSGDINAYLQEHAGEEFTAKDFRTWMGSVHAVAALREAGAAEDAESAKKNIVTAVDYVADQLQNTRAVCRASYIHPLLFTLYEEGKLMDLINGERWGRKWLAPDEVALLRVLREGAGNSD